MQEFFQWFLKPAEQFRAGGTVVVPIPLYEQVSHDLEVGAGPGASRCCEEPEQPGRLLQEQGKYAEAEPLYRRALAIREKALGPEHLDVATS